VAEHPRRAAVLDLTMLSECRGNCRPSHCEPLGWPFDGNGTSMANELRRCPLSSRLVDLGPVHRGARLSRAT
jgi:hypothetical protein